MRSAGRPAEQHRAAAERREEVKDLQTESSSLRPLRSHDERLILQLAFVSINGLKRSKTSFKDCSRKLKLKVKHLDANQHSGN